MWRKIVLNSLYFSGIQAAMTPYVGGLGSILMLHRIQNPKRKPFSPNHHLSASPEFLDRMILRLKTSGYDFITMDEVVERLQTPEKFRGSKPFLSITLDDGYRDNLTNAVPIFRRHQVPYTIYIAPGMTEANAPLWWEDVEHIIASQKKISVALDAGVKEFDVSTIENKKTAYKFLIVHLMLQTDQYVQREIVERLCKAYGYDCFEYARKDLMNWQEVISLSKDPLCTIGAHTINHYALSKLSLEDAKTEIMKSREVITAKIGIEPKHLAYPYGFCEVAGPREFELTKKLGFATATTTRHGVIYPEHKDHMTALPRVSLNGNHQSMRYVNTLLSGIPTRFKNTGKKLDVN